VLRRRTLRISSGISVLSLMIVTVAALFARSTFSVQANVPEIIRRSVEANNRDWAAAPQFSFLERDLDSKAGWKTYQVTQVLGSPYQRLIAIDGKPLDRGEQAEQQQKYDEMIAKRKSESPQQHAQRIAKYNLGRNRNKAMLDQLTKAFNFTLRGEDTLGGHKVYVLKATPKAGYQPPDRDTQVLPGMEGELWIDEETFQWVKVEAHVIRPVSIEGFVAEVQSGTRFELEKTPVSGDIWLPSHYSMQASAKIFFLFPHHSQENDYYWDYREQKSFSSVEVSSRGTAGHESRVKR
jgi:hypothetical protein